MRRRATLTSPTLKETSPSTSAPRGLQLSAAWPARAPAMPPSSRLIASRACAPLSRSAGRTARLATGTRSGHQAAIRDVAAGVAAPALVGCVLWMLREAKSRKLRRLRFLSRDGQVLFALAGRLAAKLRMDIDLEYVYSSRITWSLAATDPGRLSSERWLFNSFMKSNVTDVCARLGLRVEDYQPELAAAGVSLDPEHRADQAGQLEALQRFVDSPTVAEAASERVAAMRSLVAGYATQHDLAEPDTGLVDAGWTGRMIGSLVSVCEARGMGRPNVLLWGHEPRATGWTDPERVAAYMYDTSRGEGLDLRVPDAPFIVETFCMGDHGIVSGYRKTPAGRIEAILSAEVNSAAAAWGLEVYRSVLYAFCDALDGNLDDDVRPLVHETMDAFWCHPTREEAEAWGSYPYDSDPTGTAARRLARALDPGHASGAGGNAGTARGDRAWLAGSLALSSPAVRTEFAASELGPDWTGAPATD
jgi:hypothetical protein